MKCKICGKEIEKSSYSNDILCSSECFHVNFWNELVEEYNKDPYHNPVVNGTKYYVGDENNAGAFRGFDGARFCILFNDGTIILSTNLWCNGEVPEEYKDKLKNNAKFITMMEYEELIKKENK